MRSNNDFDIVDDEKGFGRCLVLAGPWRPEHAQIMQSQGVTGLRLSSSSGWKERDISFVADLDFLTAIEVYSSSVEDVTPIFRNTGLRYVALQCPFRSKAEFQLLRNLQACFIKWCPKVSGLEECTRLRYLNIVNYPYENLIGLSTLTRVERFLIISRKLTSLSGVESMSKLKMFDAALSPNLIDISGLMECIDLESVRFNGCRRVSIPGDIALNNLLELSLENCGQIESLQPLANCKKLQQLGFAGDTAIVDGNLDFLLKHPTIRDVWYANRAHYTITREDLKRRLRE